VRGEPVYQNSTNRDIRPIRDETLQSPTPGGRKRLFSKASYSRWLPSYAWQVVTRRATRGPVHLVIAIADHFEPSIVPGKGRARASYEEQDRRLEAWCREYPKTIEPWRDHDGRPLVHTYFYPAEQYEKALVERLAIHCQSGWGEIEIHLHHGPEKPDTAENTRLQLLRFRDALASTHGCLSYLDGSSVPQYAFVHGNFALANSAGGRACGVDSELQVLAETGCYADLTLPTAAFHSAQIAKVNSLYECSLPLSERAAHRRGHDLRRGRSPSIFPLMIQGPLLMTFGGSARNGRVGIENAALTGAQPPSLQRLRLWKKAGISVQGRPDWVFIKLHCHSMNPTDRDAVIGQSFQRFLTELVQGAAGRGETIHFVTAREMVNIIWAACHGKEGDPSVYRDYRLKLDKQRVMVDSLTSADSSPRV
jgi:hypothetical protein